MIKVDLNSDIGEIPSNIANGRDEQIIREITSANIACGYHAGDEKSMLQTVKTAKMYGVHVGAHPSYPDRENFGRSEMQLSANEITDIVEKQITLLSAVCNAESVKLKHVKPHGALYNMAVRDKTIADAISKAILKTDSSLILLAPFGSKMIESAQEQRIKTACEVFADRAYNDNGTLVSRKLPGAVISDCNAVIKRVLQMVLEGNVTTVKGNIIPVKADSICVHGDNPEAVKLPKAIRRALEENGIIITPISQL